MYKRTSMTVNLTINPVFLIGKTEYHMVDSLEIAAEGVLDADEGYFEVSDIYMQEARANGSYDIPKRVKKALMSERFAEAFDETAWGAA